MKLKKKEKNGNVPETKIGRVAPKQVSKCCENCRYWGRHYRVPQVSRMQGLQLAKMCNRFPASVPKAPDSYCGEWQGK